MWEGVRIFLLLLLEVCVKVSGLDGKEVLKGLRDFFFYRLLL